MYPLDEMVNYNRGVPLRKVKRKNLLLFNGKLKKKVFSLLYFIHLLMFNMMHV